MQFLLFALSAAVTVTALPQVLVELDQPKSTTTGLNQTQTVFSPTTCTKVIDIVGDVGARGCWGIAQDNQVPWHDVMAWNADIVGEECRNLQLGQTLCVQKKGVCSKYAKVPRDGLSACSSIVQKLGLKDEMELERLNPYIHCSTGQWVVADDYVCVAAP